jgi:hypothetical protein
MYIVKDAEDNIVAITTRKADADALVNTLLDDLVCVVEHVDVDVSLRTFIGDNKK